MLPSVTIVTPAGNQVLDASARARSIGAAGDYGFTEGPCWVPASSAWIFSDIPKATQYVFSPDSGTVEVFRESSNFSNGNFLDNEGRLLTCEHGSRSLTRARIVGTAQVGDRETIASSWNSVALNSPNDCIQSHHSHKTIFFTDPDYGIIPRIGHGQAIEQAKNHVFRLDPESGEMSVLADDFVRPNGLCLNSSETKFYVADSGASVAGSGFDSQLPHHVRCFDISADGKTISNSRVFCTVADGDGVPDGVRCDENGNVWVCTYVGVHVYSPDGQIIARIDTPEHCANAAFGGASGTDLMMCTQTSVWLIPTKVQGAGDVRK